MNKLKKIIRGNKILNLVPRLVDSTRYYNFRYLQIAKWSVASNEDTNYTYELTNGNWSTLAFTISIVLNRPFAEIKGYLDEVRSDMELTSHILQATQQSGFQSRADREVRLHKRAGWYAFVRAMKPRLVVETGVDKGLGSVTLCAALARNRREGTPGKYLGTDINPEAGYLLSGPYAAEGRILYGDSIESLRKIEDTIDLFINDSDHSENYEWDEYMTILPKLGEASIILGDNSHVTDKLLQFSIAQNRKYLFFKEEPLNHWYPGGGIGISFS